VITKISNSKDGYIVIAMTVMVSRKQTEAYGWMRDKWNAKNNKKGYLKIHIVAANVKTKKIISMKVTIDDEHVHNSKALPELVDEVTKSDKK
jgi:hypothetical protein